MSKIQCINSNQIHITQNAVVSLKLAGRNTAKQDRNGNITRYEYDRNRQKTEYQYDANGNQTKVR